MAQTTRLTSFGLSFVVAAFHIPLRPSFVDNNDLHMQYNNKFYEDNI
jgi:hypothetical protein